MNLSTQFITMLTMIGMGIVFGGAFDTYNRLFDRSNRHKAVTFLNDIMFWLLQGLIVFYLLLIINDGEIRFYIFLALLCGFAAYQSLFKSSYLYLLAKMIAAIKYIYRIISYVSKTIIFRPIYSLVLLVISIIVSLVKGLSTLVKYIYNGVLFIISIIFKIIFFPIKLIGVFFYKNILPKGITKRLKTVYNKIYNLKGYFKKLFKK